MSAVNVPRANGARTPWLLRGDAAQRAWIDEERAAQRDERPASIADILTEAVLDCGGDTTAGCLLFHIERLAPYSGDKGPKRKRLPWIPRSREEWARRVGVSVGRIDDAVAELVEHELIEKCQRWWGERDERAPILWVLLARTPRNRRRLDRCADKHRDWCERCGWTQSAYWAEYGQLSRSPDSANENRVDRPIRGSRTESITESGDPSYMRYQKEQQRKQEHGEEREAASLREASLSARVAVSEIETERDVRVDATLFRSHTEILTFRL